MRKSALSLMLVLLASLPVAAQQQIENLIAQVKTTVAWLDSVAYMDSVMASTGEADEIIRARLSPCSGCDQVVALFESDPQNSTTWKDAQQRLWEGGYILQCANGMGRLPDADLSMASVFLFKVKDTARVNANDYIIPGLQELSGDNDVTVYIVDPVIIPFGKRGNFPAGMATMGPRGEIVPYVFSPYTDLLPKVFVQVAFWRHIIQNGLWETDEIRPSFVSHFKDGSIEWMKEEFDLAEEWDGFLNEISAANHAQLIANEVSHVISARKWSTDVPCPMPYDAYQAFEALSDATSLETLAKQGDIHFFPLMASSYFNRVESSGYAGYAESERIFRQTGQWLLDGLGDQLLEDGQTEWREQLGLSRVQHQGDLRSIFLDLYFLFDDDAYRRYVVEPFAAHYGELTLERLAELGININKR